MDDINTRNATRLHQRTVHYFFIELTVLLPGIPEASINVDCKLVLLASGGSHHYLESIHRTATADNHLI